jgi:hypothetical protein
LFQQQIKTSTTQLFIYSFIFFLLFVDDHIIIEKKKETRNQQENREAYTNSLARKK